MSAAPSTSGQPASSISGNNSGSPPQQAGSSTAGAQPSSASHHKRSSKSRDQKYENNPDINLPGIGNYVFIRTLGEGNFAKVKLGRHKMTNQEVAIKIIDKTKLDEKKLSKLYREVKIMKLLHHPHIVRLYEVIETKYTLFLVMECCTGGELYDYLVVHGRMKEKEARAKFRQILSAVSYCHKQRVIHRDLKAENLLLDANMNVKIADFGFSNYYDPDDKLDTFCGSPPYAAPELFQGRKYTGPEVDVWSLGVILYVLTTGCLPFDGKNLQEMRDSVCRGKYRVPFYLSDACEKLFKKCLVRDPSKRATLDHLVDDPWLMEGFTDSPITRDIAQKIDEDDEVLATMEKKFKIDRKAILHSLRDHLYDDTAAIYHLLYHEKVLKTQDPGSILSPTDSSAASSASAAAAAAGSQTPMGNNVGSGTPATTTVPPMDPTGTHHIYANNSGPASSRHNITMIDENNVLKPTAVAPTPTTTTTTSTTTTTALTTGAAGMATANASAAAAAAAAAAAEQQDAFPAAGEAAAAADAQAKNLVKKKAATRRRRATVGGEADPRGLDDEPASPGTQGLPLGQAAGLANNITIAEDAEAGAGGAGGTAVNESVQQASVAGPAAVGTVPAASAGTSVGQQQQQQQQGTASASPRNSVVPAAATSSDKERESASPGTGAGDAGVTTDSPNAVPFPGAGDANVSSSSSSSAANNNAADKPGRKRHNTFVGIFRNNGGAANGGGAAVGSVGGNANANTTVASGNTNTNAGMPAKTAAQPQLQNIEGSNSNVTGSSAGGVAAVPQDGSTDEGSIKPRSLRFTFNSNTTSSREPDEIMAELKTVLTDLTYKYVVTSPFLLTCKTTAEDLELEVEVCKLPRLKNMHGLRFKRIMGSSAEYKQVCEKILANVKLN